MLATLLNVTVLNSLRDPITAVGETVILLGFPWSG